MKFCTTCGAQMQDGQLFCSKCGYYISILINPGLGDLDCAKDILACFS